MHSHRSPDPTPEDIRRGYEGTAITVKGFVIFVVLFVASILAVQYLIWLVYDGMSDGQRVANEARFPPPVLADAALVTRPRQPTLQPAPGHDEVPWRDMEELRERQTEGLKTRGWDPATQPSRPLSQFRFPHQLVPQVEETLTRLRGAPPATQPAVQGQGSGAAGTSGAGAGTTAVVGGGVAEPSPAQPATASPSQPAVTQPTTSEPVANQPSSATQPAATQPATQPQQVGQTEAVGSSGQPGETAGGKS